MRTFLLTGLQLSLLACGEVAKENYLTLADAKRTGAIDRGWVPTFVPDSAHGIREVHDIDSNVQTLEFTTRLADIQRMVTGLDPVSVVDKAASAELSKNLGFSEASEVFVVCSNPLNGALIIDLDTGRTVYRTPAAWADDDCSQA